MLDNFFNPKSIAVIGASRTPGKVGYDVLKNLIQYGYQGVIYPINPEASEILGCLEPLFEQIGRRLRGQLGDRI